LVFERRGDPENSRKILDGKRTNFKLNTRMNPGRNGTQARRKEVKR